MLPRLGKEKATAYQAAIRLSICGYHIAPCDEMGNPHMPTGTTAFPSYSGRSVQWLPVFVETRRRQAISPDGKVMTVQVTKPGAVAYTAMDGVTVFFGRFRTAADLAVALHHERIHFEQFTSARASWTDAQREEEAYRRGSEEFEKFKFPESDPNTTRLKLWLKNQRTLFATKAANEKNFGNRLGRFLGIIPVENVSSAEFPHLKEEREALKAGARDMERDVVRTANLRALNSLATAGCSGSPLDYTLAQTIASDGDRAFYLRAEATFWTDHRGARTCADFLYASFLTHLATHDKLDARLLAELKRGHLDGFRNFARRHCAGERLRTHDYAAIWYFEGRKLYAREADRVLREATGRLSCEEDKFTSDLGWLAAGRLPPEPAYAEPVADPPKVEAPNANDPPRAYAEPVRPPASADADLETLAKAACADPAGLDWRKLPDLHWFPYPDVNLGKRSRARWTECEGRVYDHLLGMNAGWKSLDLDEIRRVARPPALPAPGGAFEAPRADIPRGGCGAANPRTDIVGCPQPN